MFRTLSRIGLVALALAALPLAAPGTASAEEFYREFFGRIDKINKKKMIVDNRMGDKVSFVPADETEVIDARGKEGSTKDAWKDLKKNDWVTVSWKMVDKPRIAYKVKVMQPKQEAGDDL